ncbi:MAG: BamA/TamA family outer membrane protein [Archangium sp.]
MSRLLALLILTLVCAGCVTAPPTPDARKVDDFEIEGTKELSEGDVKSKIVTTESPWLSYIAPWLSSPQWFDPLAWQADLRRIQRYYEANGYYQARVTDDEITEVGKDKVKILVKLREGDPARVETLTILGLEALPEDMQEDVTRSLPLERGDIFLEDSWERAKKLLSVRLRELGFAEVAVTGEALVDAENARVDLKLNIDTGPRYKIGKTFVATDPGATVPAKLIAEVSAPELVPGDWFSESALNKAQSRVFQMGVFAGVKVNRGLPDRASQTVPIVIDTREAPFKSIRLGVGLGGDLIRQEAHLIGEFTNRNLGLSSLVNKNQILDRLTLKAKLGIAFVPNVIDVARALPTAKWGPIWSLNVEYEVPRIFQIPTLSMVTNVEILRLLDNAFDYDALEPKYGFVWRPTTDVTIFPSINANIFLLRTEFSLLEAGPTDALGCPTQPNLCVVGFLDLMAEWDRRDNRAEPREGFYAAMNVSGGLAQTQRVNPFIRVTPEVRGYVSFGIEKRVTLAGRIKAGSIFAPDNDTPIVMRYFSGGSGMRGFQTRRLSPMRAVPTLQLVEDPACQGQFGCRLIPNPDPSVGAARGKTLPIGGSGLIEASLELRWAITENWVLALFNDWGTVTVDTLFAPGQNLLATLYTAVGFGVRYRTPLGPIRVDLAFRLPFVGGVQVVDPGGTTAYQSQPGCFFGAGSGQLYWDSMTYAPTPTPMQAGMPDNLCSAHLSIGEAF